MAVPEAALAIVPGDDGTAPERSWKRLESAPGPCENAADLSAVEPSARRSG
jgi:hypothetical protein